MARSIEARFYLTGDLVALTPLHIGSGRADLNSDMPLARDGQGRLYIPGTSLAGMIREYLRHHYGSAAPEEDQFRHLLGYQDGEGGWASQLVVEDAVLKDEPAVELRDGIGIDRMTGTAADRIKFDREVLPRGTRIPLRLTVDCLRPDEATRAKKALESLVAALSRSRLRMGAAKSRGLGRMKLEKSKLFRFSLRSRAGMLSFLKHRLGVTEQEACHLDTQDVTERPRLAIKIHWHAVGPLMVKAAAEGSGADMLPLMTGVTDGILPVIPGSSIKGIVRTEAERILRTIWNPPPIEERDAKKRFLKQLDELELITWMFGRASTRDLDSEELERRQKPTDGGANEVSDTPEPMRGYSAIGFDDCYPKTGHGLSPLPVQVWREITNAAVDPLAHNANDPPGQRTAALGRLLERYGLPRWTVAFHVAIDRWTGSASDGMFFKVLEPRDVPWEQMQCEIALDRLPTDKQLPALALLLLVFERMSRGLVPIGYGGNRGMGEIVVDGMEITGHALPDSLSELQENRISPFSLTNMPTSLVVRLREEWRNYVQDRRP